MGMESVPPRSHNKGYDYCNSVWRDIAVTRSGEPIPARGETIFAAETVIATAASGGQVLGSGVIERVHIRVPEIICSGDSRYVSYLYSGMPYGIMLGGRSGTGYEPYLPNILSGSDYSFCVTSGQGIWMPPGTQKEIYVRALEEIHVVGEPSGYPVTYAAEVIVC